MNRGAEITVRIFYAAFLFLFAFLTLGVLTGNVGYEYNFFFLFAFVCAFTALFVATAFALRKYAAQISRYEAVILPAVLLIFFAVQLYLGWKLRFASAFDFASVYRGAVQWAETGTFASYYEYYQYFPNNLGAMSLLFLFFKAAGIFGITNYFMLGVLLNSLLLCLTMLFSYLTAKKLMGYAGGLLCLCFFLASPPFYILGAAFYTDALSMLFPVLFYYLYLCLKNGSVRKRFLYVAMALTVTLGAMVKFTVIIMAIAAILDLLFSGKIRRACIVVTAVCVCFLTVQTVFDSYLYTNHLNREEAAQRNTPLLHWVMMGLNASSSGAYHPDDYTFTRSFTDVQERDAAILQEIGHRVRELGFDGITRLYTRKVIKAFGDGTYAISDFLDDGPEERGRLHEYVLYDGARYSTYQYITQTALLTVYFFIVAAAVRALKRCDRSVLALFAAVFGLILFLAVWESSSRYFLNFVPVLFVLATYGAQTKSVKYL